MMIRVCVVMIAVLFGGILATGPAGTASGQEYIPTPPGSPRDPAQPPARLVPDGQPAAAQRPGLLPDGPVISGPGGSDSGGNYSGGSNSGVTRPAEAGPVGCGPVVSGEGAVVVPAQPSVTSWLRTAINGHHGTRHWKGPPPRYVAPEYYEYLNERYPKFRGGFHSNYLDNIGFPHGDIGIRGNGIYPTPW